MYKLHVNVDRSPADHVQPIFYVEAVFRLFVTYRGGIAGWLDWTLTVPFYGTRALTSFTTTNSAKLCGLLPVNVQNWSNQYFYPLTETLVAELISIFACSTTY